MDAPDDSRGAPTAGALGRTGLVLENVSFAFGATDGVRDLNLQALAGEQLALLGPSGVGKTTLLRAIAGLHAVKSGRILLNGRDITTLAPERRGVVYLHQTPALFPHLSVLDNVAFPLEVRGVARADARAQASVLLARVQLDALASRSPTALSGGQRHRVALARALAARPQVLLLDEPFAALDPSLRAEVRDAVFTLLTATSDTSRRDDASEKPVVMLVTHDVDEAVALTQRVVVLLDGRIAQDEASSTALARPRTLEVARFLGVPNLVQGVRDALGVVTSVLGALPSVGRAGAVWIATRPDALTVSRCAPVVSAENDDGRRMHRGAVPGVDLNDDSNDESNPGSNDQSNDPANDLTGAGGGRPRIVGTVLAVLERMSGATVQVRVGDAAVLAQRAGDELRVGDQVSVRLHRSRIHVIDADTVHV
jgi:ABC-type sulfate/molybdate transport systems ATPase subunit